VGLVDAAAELLGLQAGDPPVELLLVGQLDAEAALGGVREDVPVVMQGGIDVDGDAHGDPSAGGRLSRGAALLSVS
jgi:hypothetical protein